MAPASKNKARTSCMSFAMIVPAKSVEITEKFSPALRALAQPAVELYSMLNMNLGAGLIMEREYINCVMID